MDKARTHFSASHTKSVARGATMELAEPSQALSRCSMVGDSLLSS